MKMFVLCLLNALTFVTVGASPIILGGFEDTPVVGGDRDYQDLTFTITGAILHTSTGFFTPLTPSLILDNGNVFWDHVSGDGPNDNIGNIWLDDYVGVQYLSDFGGTLDPDVWFQGGSTVTITGGQTSDTDKLYECSLGGFGCQAINGSLTFTPIGDWEVMATVNSGAEYFSDPTWQQSSSFAFGEAVNTPEPNAAWMAFCGLALVLCARSRQNQRG